MDEPELAYRETFNRLRALFPSNADLTAAQRSAEEGEWDGAFFELIESALQWEVFGADFTTTLTGGFTSPLIEEFLDTLNRAA